MTTNKAKAKKAEEFIPNSVPKTQLDLKVTKTEMVEMVAEGLKERARADSEKAEEATQKATTASREFSQGLSEKQAQEIVDTYAKAGFKIGLDNINVRFSENYNKSKKSDPDFLYAVNLNSKSNSFFPTKVFGECNVEIEFSVEPSKKDIAEYRRLEKKRSEANKTYAEASRREHHECTTKSVKAKMNAQIIANMKGGATLVENLFGMIDTMHAEMNKPKLTNG
tara:strand:- start:6312 stop:6983 length:672 start_codon:yes stop_codon:yes gene_type:complete